MASSSEVDDFSETASDLVFINDLSGSDDIECETHREAAPESAVSDESLEVLYELQALREEKEKKVNYATL